jgi:hypothetical protein
VVWFCNERCNQEKLIEQLKNAVNALRMPVDTLVSNWSYRVMASLAWALKAWFALLVRNREQRNEFLRMEFRRFLNRILEMQAQIVSAGRVSHLQEAQQRAFLKPVRWSGFLACLASEI